MYVIYTSARRRKRPSARPERSQLLQILPSLTVRQLFSVSAFFSCCANIGGRLVFSMHQCFYMRQGFNHALMFLYVPRFLDAPMFLYAPRFLEAPRLLGCPNVFVNICRRLYFCVFFWNRNRVYVPETNIIYLTNCC